MLAQLRDSTVDILELLSFLFFILYFESCDQIHNFILVLDRLEVPILNDELKLLKLQVGLPQLEVVVKRRRHERDQHFK